MKKVNWIAILTFLTAGGATATTLSISPAGNINNAGQLLTLDVDISGVSDLYAWQFDLTFDPTILNATGVTESGFLSTGGSTFFIPGTIDNVAGSVAFNSDTLLAAVPGVDGSGELAEVQFQTIGLGISAVDLANVFLLDSGLNFISADTSGDSVTVVPEPSGRAFSVLCLLAFFSLSKIAGRAGLRGKARGSVAVAVFAVAGGLAQQAWGIDIATSQFDSSRTLANTSEVYLTTSNVNGTRFGKLFARPVDGSISGQPLYLQGVTVGGKKVNLVYVATSHDTVYAFDADNPAASAPVWSVNLGQYDWPPGWSQKLGIISTPLIVRSSGTMYLVAATLESGSRVHRLHALDILTGAEKFGGPVIISGSVPGTAGDAVGGVITFNPNTQIQRTGLALSGTNIVMAFGPDRDHPPYHGWVFTYNMNTLQQTGIFNDALNNVWDYGTGAGIWQSGRAPAVDASGAIYLETGNGDFDGVMDFGESFLKLNASPGGLSLADWFTPSSWQALNAVDYDLGSTGPTLIPGTNLFFGGSKSGTVYLLATTGLGQLSSGDTNIVQSFTATSGCIIPYIDQGCAQIMGQIFWAAAPVPTLYVWGVHDVIRSYQFSGGRFNTAPAKVGTLRAYYPGGLMALSSYLGTPGTGIIWATTYDSPDDSYFIPGNTGPATLHAFDAADPAVELWNSSQNPTRDALGQFGGFGTAVAVNGKVYVPTFQDQLVVYGLLNGPVPGDVNGDNVASCADMSIVKASYGKSAGQTGFDLRADVNSDGVVNILDLATVARNLPAGTSCP